MPSKLDRAVVYPICMGNERDSSIELLLSLRSVEKNLTDKVPVFILSEKVPPYLSDDVNFIRVESYQDALAHTCNIAAEILWMNDDIFLLKPHSWDDFKVWMTNISPTSDRQITNLISSDNSWRKKRGHIFQDLKKMGKSLYDFSTHTPYLYETDKLAEVLIKFNYGYKTAIETAYGNYWGVPRRPLDLLMRHHTGQLPMDCSKYGIMNYDDKGANPHCRGFLLGMFPSPSIYEFHRGDLSKTLMTSIK